MIERWAGIAGSHTLHEADTGDVLLSSTSIPFGISAKINNSVRSATLCVETGDSSRHQIDREVKKEETCLRRAQHAAEYLMEAMEAEPDSPPLMKAAFRRNVSKIYYRQFRPPLHAAVPNFISENPCDP